MTVVVRSEKTFTHSSIEERKEEKNKENSTRVKLDTAAQNGRDFPKTLELEFSETFVFKNLAQLLYGREPTVQGAIYSHPASNSVVQATDNVHFGLLSRLRRVTFSLKRVACLQPLSR